MIVDLGGIPFRRGTAAIDVTDLAPTVKRAGAPKWLDPRRVDLPLTGTPTDEQARLIRRRLVTRDATEEAMVTAIVNARKNLPALGLLTNEGKLLKALSDYVLAQFGE